MLQTADRSPAPQGQPLSSRQPSLAEWLLQFPGGPAAGAQAPELRGSAPPAVSPGASQDDPPASDTGSCFLQV